MKPLFSRNRLYSWHSWLGLVTGIFMILIGFSGSIAVFKHEIDWLVTPALRVPPQGTPVSPDMLVASLKENFPGGEIQSLEFREGQRSAHVAKVNDASRKRLEVYLDPYSGKVRGQKQVDGYTWSLQNFIRQFHVRLLMGFWGRVFVGVFGVTLFLSCLTGFYVYRNWFKTLFRMRFGKGLRLMTSDMHKVVGVWSLIFNLLIGATGAVLGLQNLYGRVRYDWLGVEREQMPRLALEELRAYGDSARPLPPSRLLEIASLRFPDMKPRILWFPEKPRDAAELVGDHPGTFIMDRASKVAINPFDGQVLQAVDARAESFTVRLYNTFEPLHFGFFGQDFGLATEYAIKALWFLLGMTPGLLALSGFYLRFTRGRPKRPGTQGFGTTAKQDHADSEALAIAFEENSNAHPHEGCVHVPSQ